MKKFCLITGILLLLIVSAKSQVTTQVYANNSGKGCQINTDKNQVIFCDYKTDTLTVEQLSKCNEINVLTDPAMEVVSYSIVYRFGKDNIYEYNGSGKNLPKAVVEKIINDDIAYFWVEKITIKKDGEVKNLGTRKFYLKG